MAESHTPKIAHRMRRPLPRVANTPVTSRACARDPHFVGPDYHANRSSLSRRGRGRGRGRRRGRGCGRGVSPRQLSRHSKGERGPRGPTKNSRWSWRSAERYSACGVAATNARNERKRAPSNADTIGPASSMALPADRSPALKVTGKLPSSEPVGKGCISTATLPACRCTSGLGKPRRRVRWAARSQVSRAPINVTSSS